MSDPFLAQIIIFAGNFAPRGWAFCQGQLLPISQNSALFSLLGTTYGGDGRTTFGLPDMRGRAAMHAGHGPGLTNRKLGAKFGTEFNNLNSTQMAAHSHVAINRLTGLAGIQVNTDPGEEANPSGNFIASSGGTVDLFKDEHDGNMLGGASGDVTGSMSLLNTGASTAVLNLQPYLSLNYIIALTGTFPSRS